MPRYFTQPSSSPFAKVLINYMWNRRLPYEPPLTVGSLATRLGISRQSVANWVNSGLMPSFKTMLTVMAKLDIPIEELLQAYEEDGVPVPPYAKLSDTSGTGSGSGSGVSTTTRPAATTTSAPAPARGQGQGQAMHEPGKGQTRQERQERQEESEPQLREASADTTPASAFSEQERWDRLITQAQWAMRDAGLSADAVAAIVRHIRANQQGYDPLCQYQQGEHETETGIYTARGDGDGDGGEDSTDRPTPPSVPSRSTASSSGSSQSSRASRSGSGRKD